MAPTRAAEEIESVTAALLLSLLLSLELEEPELDDEPEPEPEEADAELLELLDDFCAACPDVGWP